MQKIVFSSSLTDEIATAFSAAEHDKTFVLYDETTYQLCRPIVENALKKVAEDIQEIIIPAGDDNKNIASISKVWEALSKGGATRHSLLINIGGGMVTDLGGFAAASFKRGINFINIPTTLLSQVDASVGGKTGINFCGYKNEIGAFSDASTVIISSQFLKSLDEENILSGYAEMLKHALLKDRQMLNAHLAFDPYPTALLSPEKEEKAHNENTTPASGASVLDTPENYYTTIQQMVEQSVAVKQKIVEEDPHEKGIRKALNLGHTIGHAFESWAMRHKCHVLHGYAVAWGMVCELYLSAKKCGFPTDTLHKVSTFIKENYGTPAITCNDYPELLELMTHDKKNSNGNINFTLLRNVGEIDINQSADKQDIEDALDFFLF
ncbi:MAG: 3-dehydroquinate synthase [Bacteroidaceae bacterium]|nr:3-dehydroquinate synthase [Bacteroidaceae bacterium]